MLGEGAVTIVDGRTMVTNVADITDRATPELIDVRLHLLPAGSRYLPADGRRTGQADVALAARFPGKRHETEPDLMRIIEKRFLRGPNLYSRTPA